MKIHSYKVTDGKFKGKIVKSFESTLGLTFNTPFGVFDDNGNEYIVSVGELEWLNTIEEETPSYETVKKFGFEGTYEDYLESLKHFI